MEKGEREALYEANTTWSWGNDTNGNGLVMEAPRQGKALAWLRLQLLRANGLLHGK